MGDTKQEKIAVLSIDGGGIRGIIPATILNYLENRLNEIADPKNQKQRSFLCEYFDFFAGTSTGGILSCVYVTPNKGGRTPEYTAEEALNVYVEKGNGIFDVSLFEKIRRGGNFLDERYPSRTMEAVLLEYFGSMKLSETLKPCLFTAYDFEKRRAKFFTSIDAVRNKRDDFFIRDVARATSAAPTYFEPAEIRSSEDIPFHLMDGGVFANNPALCTYSELRKIPIHLLQDYAPDKTKIYYDTHSPKEIKEAYHPCIRDMIFVSIGTGSVKKPYKFKDVKNKGAVTWISPIIDILMSANSETVQYQMRKMYETIDEGKATKSEIDYFRFDPELYDASSEMDDASPKNIMRLRDAGLRFIDDNGDLLDQLAVKLQGSFKSLH